MKDINIKGWLKIVWSNNMVQYGIYKGDEYVDIDCMLWGNVGRQVGITINDNNGVNIFDAEGKLAVTYKLGYEQYLIMKDKKVFNLDKALFDYVERKVEIIFKGFKVELAEDELNESEDNLSCVNQS